VKWNRKNLRAVSGKGTQCTPTTICREADSRISEARKKAIPRVITLEDKYWDTDTISKRILNKYSDSI
jgi:hypothetical protein